jgi:hypothetical protein
MVPKTDIGVATTDTTGRLARPEHVGRQLLQQLQTTVALLAKLAKIMETISGVTYKVIVKWIAAITETGVCKNHKSQCLPELILKWDHSL